MFIRFAVILLLLTDELQPNAFLVEFDLWEKYDWWSACLSRNVVEFLNIMIICGFFCYLSRTPGLLQCNCNINVTLLYKRDAFCFADWRIRYYPQPVGGIEPITERDLCIIFCRSVSGFVNGCPCGVWCCELTTCPCMWFHFLAKLFWYWETYMRRFSAK